jgi:tricorn protease
VRPADGSGEERRVTTDGNTWRFAPAWSPDSRLLAFGDKAQRLRILDVASGRSHRRGSGLLQRPHHLPLVARQPLAGLREGGRRDAAPGDLGLLGPAGRTHQLTSGFTSDTQPVFDPKGRYLYFLSNRDFRLTFSGYEFNYVYTDPTRVYVGVLAKDGPALFLPQSDEEPARPDDTLRPPAPPRSQPQQQVPPAEPQKPPPGEPQAPPPAQPPAQPPTPAADRAGDAQVQAPQSPAGPDAHRPGAVSVAIDVEGFEQRVRAVPGAPADQRFLSATDRAVLYMVGQGPQARLAMYDVEDKKESTILTGIDQYVLSSDGKKVLFRRGEQYGIADVKPTRRTPTACSRSTR